MSAPKVPGTGEQLFTDEEQLEHARIIRDFFAGAESDPGAIGKVLHPKIRIFFDSYPTDPVVFEENKSFVGPMALKEMNDRYADKGFTYDIEIHGIFTCGPVVVVTRTDTRKQEGKPDIAFPAVGVFAFRDGKIVEWSDYYR
jgi:limonene-1,2-epoxide hydrolase